ncbi:MAG: hypothetical protein KJN64_14530 [Ignavibacteria bacterium]|nr:hypothetical protein [Ignavibacteria bacterium]MBT8380908.1 hypothetical protein [Ignavibacteria bacterium]MBT8391013.1 hypothetical protein [Ignavibacteria bacterium]NNJ54161.1 hypothetical protein [Ignavibacteriaceae bacterium]NNL20668.1 hypothetical protein [Ignavibacteriaceae bacterium]
MIKVIQVIVVGILIFLIVRLVRLIMSYSAGIKSKIDSREKEKEKIRQQFDNIEEAEFRDISKDEEGNIKEKDNG